VLPEASYCKVRVDRRIVSQALAIVIGLSADRRRVALDFEGGDGETGPLWKALLRSLRTGSLPGVKLVSSETPTPG
jgi:transposase-like protein